MTIEVLDGWVSLPTAAKQLGMSRQALAERVRRGKLPPSDVRMIKGSRAVVISEAYVADELGYQRYLANKKEIG